MGISKRFSLCSRKKERKISNVKAKIRNKKMIESATEVWRTHSDDKIDV
jgi:hypothetical protein